VEIGGKKLSVPAEVAEAVIALKASSEATLRQAQDMIASLKQGAAPAGGASPGADPDAAFYKQLETDLFTDPAGAAKRLVERAVATAEAKLTNSYRAERGQEQFWSDFYAAHADLRTHKEYVTFVAMRDFEALKALPTTQAINKIAETVKADILKLRGNAGGTGTGRATAEGGTESGGGTSNAGSEHSLTEPKGLTGVLKQRAEARRKAARGGA
jgi:hypothetical protein